MTILKILRRKVLHFKEFNVGQTYPRKWAGLQVPSVACVKIKKLPYERDCVEITLAQRLSDSTIGLHKLPAHGYNSWGYLGGLYSFDRDRNLEINAGTFSEIEKDNPDYGHINSLLAKFAERRVA